MMLKPSKLCLRNQQINFGKQTYVMGILNMSPDSFSEDGLVDVASAINLAQKHIENGARIIDIGGQSTRPGHIPIDEETELERIIPTIKALRQASDVVISVDTFSPKVATKAILSGADIINSIWGLTDGLAYVIEKVKVPIVIMHNKLEAVYPNGVVSEVLAYFEAQTKKALALGLSKEQIILDPGFGFGKTAEHNLEILSQVNKIVALGYPTAIGTSRKSTIGKLTDKTVDDRLYGTAATVAFAIANGVDIVRVHDVKEINDVVKVTDALVRNWRPKNWTTS